MIEPIMYFGIGFLVAALIGLVVVPLVHNRAVRLTMRRLEAATPLSMADRCSWRPKDALAGSARNDSAQRPGHHASSLTARVDRALPRLAETVDTRRRSAGSHVPLLLQSR